MASWITANYLIRSKPIVFETNEKDTPSMVSPKHGLNLMQNCDLPPPVKLFSGPDKVFLPSDEIRIPEDSTQNGKWELLKALRLSQTRAREAERKINILSKEKDTLSNMVIEDSLRLFGYQQLVKLLERQQQEDNIKILGLGLSSNNREKSSKSEDYSEWRVAITLCLAIAGVGIALSCRYLS